MSRLSRPNLKARDSVFAGGPETYRGDIQAICPPNLEDCVQAMEDCCEEAYEAQQLLRNGTRDLPRMTKILANEKVFVLVNEAMVKKYSSDLADEVEPMINELIRRAEEGLAALMKTEAALKSKYHQADTRQTRLPATTLSTEKQDSRRLQLLIKQRKALEQEAKSLEEELKRRDLKALKS